MFFKPVKKIILVTGGAGYIGSHTIIELLNAGYDVIAVDDFSNSTPEVYNRIFTITGKKVKHVDFNLCNRPAVIEFFKNHKDIEGVIHFAASKSVPESVHQPGKYYYNNINSLLNIIDACLQFNVRNLIFSSSCSVYGDISSLPVKEDTPLGQATSPYAHTKQIGEMMIRDYCTAFPDFNSVSLRYFNPVGAHVSGLNGELPLNAPANLAPVMVNVANGKTNELVVFGTDYDTRDGSCIRDYVHVSDIAVAHLKALEYLMQQKNKLNYDVFNLGTGNGVSVLEAIASFEKVNGIKINYRKGPRRAGDVVAIYSDTTKSKNILGWVPELTLDDMMCSAWIWSKQLSKENNPA